MSINSIENAVSKSQKLQIRKDIKDYIHGEIKYLAQEEVYTLAKKWVKSNKEFIEQIVEEELRKEIPRMVKNLRIDF